MNSLFGRSLGFAIALLVFSRVRSTASVILHKLERNYKVQNGRNRKGIKLDETFGSILCLVISYFICAIGSTLRSDTHDQREVLKRSIMVRLVYD